MLIEGIGCINSPGMLFDYLNPSPGVKHWICDLALFIDNVDEDGGSASPIYEYTNPLIANRAVGIEEVKGTNEKERVVNNLQGQRISVNSVFSVPSVLPKGVYIVDGKKIMVR